MMIEFAYHQAKCAVGFVGSGWCVDRIVMKLSRVTCSGTGIALAPTSVGISLKAAQKM